MRKGCKVEGCEGKHFGKGYCERHYDQIRNHGKTYKGTFFVPNKITINRRNAYIHLCNKYGNEIGVAIIDKENVDRCKKHRWYFHSSGYVTTKNCGKDLFLHNFILGRETSLEILCDHKNRNRSDCRISNLRECDRNQNVYNAKMRHNNKSGFIGVHFHKQAKKWVAAIRFNNKPHHIGCFDNPIDAARARDERAVEIHGDFAVLNFAKEGL